MNPRVVRAGPERAWELTGVIARAMVDDPMVRWPLHPGADAEIVRQTWAGLIGVFARAGALWETEGGGGAATWLGPEQIDAYPEIERASREHVRPYTDDDGARYAAQWDWVEEHLPEEPCWFLEVIGVDPARQGLGLGTALVEHGLGVARDQGLPAFLETANPRNVAYYERFGLHVVEEGDAPGGGPHFWFMRLDLAAR